MGGLRALLRTGNGARGRDAPGGARKAVRRRSAGTRGAGCTTRGGARSRRRGGVPGHHDGDMVPQVGECVRASASRQRTREFMSGAWSAKSFGKLLKLAELKEHLHARYLTIHHRPYLGAV